MPTPPPVVPRPHLLTAHTELRPWEAADAQALFALLDDNRARLLADFPVTLAQLATAAAAPAFIAGKQAAWQAAEALQLGVWQRETGALVGFVVLFRLDWRIGRAEVSYLVGADYEGRGLLREALTAALRWGFDALGLARVFACINPANERSWRLAEAVGFQLEGLLRHNFRDGHGELTDSRMYGLLPPDLRPLPAAAL